MSTAPVARAFSRSASPTGLNVILSAPKPSPSAIMVAISMSKPASAPSFR
jgi:hypothetical protein